MKSLLFIYNPLAGQGKIRGKLLSILDVFARHGYLTTVYPTQGPADATQAALSMGGDYDRVVCCGGDGTLHEVVSALLEMDAPPVLGYIPAGTTNDFARSLGLPRNMALAAESALTGPVLHCDIGRFNDRYFVYVAAFGTFADVSYDTPQKFKNLFGHMAYILQGIGRLGSIQSWPMKITHDTGTLEGEFILGMVSNTRSVGGFKGWPSHDVKLDDGVFEVILVRKPQNAGEVQSILHSVVTQNPGSDGPLIGFHTKSLRLECPQPVAWTLDGEFGGKHTLVQVDNIPQALDLCRGKKESKPPQEANRRPLP